MNQSVAKYWSTFLLDFKNLKEFKLNFYATLIRLPIHIFIMVAIWSIIFKVSGATSIAGLEFSQFIVYIVLARMIAMTILGWDLCLHFDHYIVYGNLTQYLVRPINFLWWTFSLLIPRALLTVVLGGVAYVLLTLVLPYFGIVTQFFPSAGYLGMFIIALLLGVVLCFLFYYLVTLLTFWIGHMWYIMSGFYTVQNLLSGELIPLTINPTFHAVASFFPFKYIVFSPLFIFLEKYTVSESFRQIGIQVMWIIAIIILIELVYKKGLKKFESFGG